MTLRVPVVGLAEGRSRPTPELLRYVKDVHRTRPEAVFTVFDPARAVEADATLAADGREAWLVVGALRPAAVRARVPLVLVQGLAKGDKCDAIVRDAAELGASEVRFVVTARSVAKPDGARSKARLDRWRRIAIEAARQATRGDAPRVELHGGLGDALEALTEGSARFVLDPAAPRRLGGDLSRILSEGAPDSGIALAAGPEGGLDEGELQLFEQHGFQRRAIGPFVLRTETVAAAILGAVRVLARD